MRNHHERKSSPLTLSWAVWTLCGIVGTIWWPVVECFGVGGIDRVRIGRTWSYSGNGGRRHSTTRRFMIGNFVSGVAGVPPKHLLDGEMREMLVEGSSLGGSVNLECAYKASRDGWSAVDFHRQVDERGSGLVVALSRSGALFGGFNPLGWRSTDDYYGSNAAFLWFAEAGKPSKLPVLIGGNAAVFDFATGGPNFGPADLVIGSPQAAVMGGFAGPDAEDISTSAGNLRQGSSSVGGAYETARGWPVRGKFSLTELEVYCNAEVLSPDGGQAPSWWPF